MNNIIKPIEHAHARVGNKKSVWATLGATSHSDTARQVDDYYATEPVAVEELLKLETFSKTVIEPCCGEGHISKVLENYGHDVISFDIVDRGFGAVQDFFEYKKNNTYDIITNPPYKYAKEFVEHALEISEVGTKIAMLLRIQFFEGSGRRELFQNNPPKTVYVSAKRIKCAINGDFQKTGSSAVCYAWYIWEKGYKGNTTIKRFNEGKYQ